MDVFDELRYEMNAVFYMHGIPDEATDLVMPLIETLMTTVLENHRKGTQPLITTLKTHLDLYRHPFVSQWTSTKCLHCDTDQMNPVHMTSSIITKEIYEATYGPQSE